MRFFLFLKFTAGSEKRGKISVMITPQLFYNKALVPKVVHCFRRCLLLSDNCLHSEVRGLKEIFSNAVCATLSLIP